MNAKVREVVTANGGEIVGEEYFPLDHMDYGETVERIMASGAEVVFNTIVPPGVTPFLEQLHDAGFAERGGQLVCTYFDENFLNMVPAAHVEGLYSCLDYYQDVDDPFSQEAARAVRRALSRAARSSRPAARARACTAALRLWEAAVTEAGSLEQDDVIAALDHAQHRRGPGRAGRDGAGPASRAHEHVHRPGDATARSRSSRASGSSIRRSAWYPRPPPERDPRPGHMAGPRSGHYGTTFEPSGPWGLASSRRVAVAAASRPKQKRVSVGRAVRW